MKLSVMPFAAAAAILWGGAILCVGVTHGIWPSYGGAFLDFVASVYPGLSRLGGAAQTTAGTVYGLFDGAVAGSLFAWIYNRLAS